MPLQEGEGPVGIVICPSRELARQTHAITVQHANALAAAGWPETRHLLCVGGEDTRSAGSHPSIRTLVTDLVSCRPTKESMCSL